MRPPLERIRATRVGHWALAYVGGAWLTLQGVDILAEQFQWPLRTQQSITVALIVGLLVTVVLGWYHGEKGRQRVSTSEILLLALVLLLGAGTLAAVRSRDPPAAAATLWPGHAVPLRVLAVLPFQSLNEDDATEALARGIHEDILTRLSGVSDLTVISRRSVLPYAHRRQNLRQIAAELGARSILEGSVRSAGGRARVTAQLIDAAEDRHLWADSWETPLDDVLGVQTTVAARVAAALDVTLSAAEARRIARPPAASMEAWRQLQDAPVDETEAPLTKDAVLAEERVLRAALALDPTYARAWARVAINFAARPWDFGMGESWADSALHAARRAVELDPDLALAYLAFGEVYQTQGYLDGAEENYARAVALDPNLARAYRQLGRVASVRGRFGAALMHLRDAIRRDPHARSVRSELGHAYAALGDIETAEAWFRVDLASRAVSAEAYNIEAWQHWWAGRLERAVIAAARAVAEEPGSPVYEAGLAELTLMAGDPRAAAAHARRARTLAHGNEQIAFLFFASTTEGIALRATGDSAGARSLLEASRVHLHSQVEQGVQWPLTYLELALVDDALGDRDRARRWILRARHLGSRHIHLITTYPGFEDLRQDPAVQVVLGRMETDIAAMRSAVEVAERAAGLR